MGAMTKEQLKAERNERSRLRMAKYIKTQAYQEYLIASRERRRLLKEKYRRKAGISPRGSKEKEKKLAAEEKKRIAEDMAMTWCECHVLLYYRREKARQKHKRKYANDATYAIYHRIKLWMHKHLGDRLPSRKWSKHLGYTPEQLRAHIERQFTRGMGWSNKGEWHIDHIVPVSSFTITSIESPDFIACFGLQNLRPVWAKENLRKSDRMEFLL